MSAEFSESVVEDATLAWLESLGYSVLHLPAPQSDLSALLDTVQAGADRRSDPLACGEALTDLDNCLQRGRDGGAGSAG